MNSGPGVRLCNMLVINFSLDKALWMTIFALFVTYFILKFYPMYE